MAPPSNVPAPTVTAGVQASPRWLSEEQQQVWRAWIATVRLLDEALDCQMRRDSNLPMADYVLLMSLSEAPDRQMRMSELAELTVYSRSRLSHAVDRLEALGWVERARCAEDGRGTLARLTDEGFDVLAAAAPGHATIVHDLMFAPLGAAGTQALGESLAAIVTALEADGPDPIAPGRPQGTR